MAIPTNFSNSTNLPVNSVTGILLRINPTIIKVFIAIIIILLGVLVSKILERILYNLFEQIELNKFVHKKLRVKGSASKFISRLVTYILYVVIIFLVLNIFEITKEFSVIVAIILGILLLLSLIFGFNDLFANFLSGIYIRVQNKVSVGDHIKTKDKNIEGIIIQMNSLNVRLETGKDEHVFVPYMALFKSEIKRKKL